MLACGICGAIALPGAALAAPFKPMVGKYTARVPGTVAQNGLTLQVLRRNRTTRTRMLKLQDDCAGSLVTTPLGLGRVFVREIKYESSGNTSSISWRLDIDGFFTSATRATVRVKTFEDVAVPPPGTPPGAARICSDDTTFTLRYRKPKK